MRVSRALAAGVMVIAITGGGVCAWADPVAVELAPDGVPAWQAATVARALAPELANDRFHAIAIRGRLAADRLTWDLVVGGAIVKHGETALHGTDVRHLAGTLEGEIGRVLQPGERQVAELPARVGSADPIALGGLAVVAVFLLVPFVRGPRKGRAFRRVIAAIGALAAVAIALVALGDYEWSWAIFAGGGLAWGGFGAAVLPELFPALPGLDRVEHADLLGVLARWAALAVQRIAAVIAIYAPFMAVAVVACVVLDVPRGVTVAVIVPVWGLCVRLWLQSWVEVRAGKLDAAMVEGPATADNPWNAAVRGYYLGYLRRAAAAADDRILDGIVFLPGTGPEVVTYGGGTTHARIVIPRAMLEVALAPYGRPHDYAAPRISTLHWTLWNAGLIMPSELGAVWATAEQRQPRSLAVEGDVDTSPFGEPATFAGFVEPGGLDERPPYRPHEDPLWLDYDSGEEFDGTDAGDKDFLFGVLVHEIGRIRRHEDRVATLVRALGPRGRRLEHVLVRRTGAVGDAHVALNYARHHFIQYLAWQLWRRDDLATARAYAPELERQTRVIAKLAADVGPAVDSDGWGKDVAGAPDLRARILRLAHMATPSKRARRIKRFAFAAVALAAAGGVAIAVVRAIDYHATYQARVAPTEKADGKGP